MVFAPLVGTAGPKSLADLLVDLNSPDQNIALGALAAIEKVPVKSLVNVPVELIHARENPVLRNRLHGLLQRVAQLDVNRFAKLVDHKEVAVRRQAVDILGYVRKNQADQAFLVFLKAFEDEDPNVKLRCETSLQRLGKYISPEVLVDGLKKGNVLAK